VDAQATTTREHPALQNMKIPYLFLYLWVIFALLDPDPLSKCGFGFGFSKIFLSVFNESGSETRVVDPDSHGSALISMVVSGSECTF
jgi:hypothetical protein